MTERQLTVRFILCLILGFVAIGFVGTGDVADEYIRGAEEKEMRPKRVLQMHRELLCDCLKLNDGKWLRLQMVQQRDRKMCKATCFYEGGKVTRGAM